MQCHEFENRLNELLDERQVPERDPQLAAHAGQCEACSQLLAGSGALYAGLATIAIPAVSADFSRVVVAEAIAETVVSKSNSPSNRTWWVLGGIAATAAGLLLMVGIAQRVRDRQAKLAGDPPVVSQPERNKPKPRSRGLAVATPGPVKPRVVAPRQPAEVAPSPVPVPAVGLSLNRPFSAYRLSIENMAATLPETVERLEEMERVSPGFRPLRVSFTVLFDALRWAIPGLHRMPQDPQEPQQTSGQFFDAWRIV